MNQPQPPPQPQPQPQQPSFPVTLDPSQRNELEEMIFKLEEENRGLQAEYRRLQIEQRQQVCGNGGSMNFNLICMIFA